MKRFLILGILGVAFSLVGCSYVGPNNDGGNWWDGLSSQEMVNGVMVSADISDSTASRADEPSSEKDIDITWALPVGIPISCDGTAFTVEWSFNENFNPTKTKVELTEENFSITTENIDVDPTDTTKYVKYIKCLCKKIRIEFDKTQYIVYFRIWMTDHNGDRYYTVVSFKVLPDGKKLRIRTAPTESEADAVNTLYYLPCPQFLPVASIPTSGKLLFNNAALDAVASNQPVNSSLDPASTYSEITLNPWTPFQMAVLSDLSAIAGISNYRFARYSNTSFCKVESQTPYTGYTGVTVDATLKYSFEDLCLDMTEAENVGFDYNDVVVYVDVLDGVVAAQ